MSPRWPLRWSLRQAPRRSPRGPRGWPGALVLAGLLLATATAGAGETPRVPEVVGLPEAGARALLEEAGYPVVVEDIAGAPAGFVASQDPGGFHRAARGTRVLLRVRRGDASAPTLPEAAPPPPPGPPLPPPPLPDVVGRTEDEALALLAIYRVILTPVDGEGAPEGQVLRMDPAAGVPLPAGRDVSLLVARAGAPPAGAVSVPAVTGLDQAAAEQQLRAAGLTSLPNPVPSDPDRAGRVVGQEPAAGTLVARGSTILLNVGRPAPSALLEAEVPALVGQPEAGARAMLAEAGYGIATRDVLAPGPNVGKVLSQRPGAGTRLLRGREVELTVGRALLLPVRVPDTMGQDAASAERTLREAGFVVERTTALSLASSVGRVVAQDPAGQVTAIRGSTVRVTIGRTPFALPVSAPDLLGLAEAEARAAAQAAGLLLRVRAAAPGVAGVAGHVQAQRPPPGTSMPRGSELEVEVVGASGIAGATVTLPSWVGVDLARARAEATERGLRVEVVYAVGSPTGYVVRQAPLPGSLVPAGGSVTLTVARPAPGGLGPVQILQPSDRVFVERRVPLTFLWNPVPDAEEYEFEAVHLKDDTWVRVTYEVVRGVERRPTGRPKVGTYRWHVRARRAGGQIVGPWSEWRRVTVH